MALHEAVPFRLKFLMLPLATPSARSDPDSWFMRTAVGVSTTVFGRETPVIARSTSVARARRDESLFALAILERRMPGRGCTSVVSFEIRPAKFDSESTAT